MSPQHVLKSQVQIFKKGGPLFFNDTSEHTGTHSESESFLVSVHRRSNTADLN
uniref:Uncharacterized protein n=1 Tax=Anguilla anguilla TaxID=7936 RepID=A0A0E9UNH6_ANGAN